MPRRVVLSLLILLLASRADAAETWTYSASEHFEVYTTGGARAARDTLTHFERVHAFFGVVLGTAPKLPTRVRLIVFSNQRQFAAYRPHDKAAAYYLPGADRDYIVMERMDAEAVPIVTHEYAHLILRHSGGTYPVWLNEGMVEFFSTLQPNGDKMRFGDPKEEHLAYLESGVAMLPVSRLFAIGHDSPEYNGGAHGSVLYAQSWALVHMLQFDEHYAPKWPQFFTLVASGTASADALTQVYGQTPERLGRDLSNYVLRRRFMAKQTKDKYELAAAEKWETRQADGFEAALVTANLLASTREGEEAARAAFTALEAQRPADLGMLESRGYFELRRGRRRDAAAYFERAVAQGSRNVRLLTDYAALDGNQAPVLLPKALALAPDDVDVRIDYTRLLANDRKSAEAIAVLGGLRQIGREQAFHAFQIAAVAYMQVGQIDEGRNAVIRVEQYADGEAQVETAKRLRASIESYAEQRVAFESRRSASALSAGAGVGVVTPEEAGRTPVTTAAGELGSSADALRRRLAVPATGITAGMATEMMTGRIIEIVCLPGNTALVLNVVNPENEVVKMLIDDPARVMVFGQSSEVVEMTCGKQNHRVSIGFAPLVNPRYGTEGYVRTLDYGK